MTGNGELVAGLEAATGALDEVLIAYAAVAERAEAAVYAFTGLGGSAGQAQAVYESVGELLRDAERLPDEVGEALAAAREVDAGLTPAENVDKLGLVVDRLTTATEGVVAAEQACDEAVSETHERLRGSSRADEIAELLSEARDRLEQARTDLDKIIDEAKAQQEGFRAGSATVGVGWPGHQCGTWGTPPKRTYHRPFNFQYEEWVRSSTGGNSGQEYKVTHGGKEIWFDARVLEVRDGVLTEVLVDAKGHYKQFVDDVSGDWLPWWRRSKEGGLEGMLDDAQRQVLVANGKPVEWWFAELEAADAFNDEIRRTPTLSGRIRAVHKPMPQ